jgi:hypothetical protein
METVVDSILVPAERHLELAGAFAELLPDAANTTKPAGADGGSL